MYAGTYTNLDHEQVGVNSPALQRVSHTYIRFSLFNHVAYYKRLIMDLKKMLDL